MESSRSPSAYQPNPLPLGQTGSQTHLFFASEGLYTWKKSFVLIGTRLLHLPHFLRVFSAFSPAVVFLSPPQLTVTVSSTCPRVSRAVQERVESTEGSHLKPSLGECARRARWKPRKGMHAGLSLIHKPCRAESVVQQAP